jgi:hypothetical protein
VERDSPAGRDMFRPLLRGRGHRSAMSLPQENFRTNFLTVYRWAPYDEFIPPMMG